MKLKNKKTGKIAPASNIAVGIGKDGKWYDSLTELNEEWEDVPEEPKEQCYINVFGEVQCRKPEEDIIPVDTELIDKLREIGNYFETREEAEKAVEKLKAWKRLKDKGFKVDLWDYDGANCQERISTGRILFRVKEYEENDKDLDLLFGGEE